MTTAHPAHHHPSHRHAHRRRTLRRTVYHMLGGEGHSDLLVKVVDFFLIALIVLNVGAVVMESVEHLSIAHGPAFHAFDLISVAIFSLEYLLRLWTAVEIDDPRYHHPVWGRLRWATSPMAIIDLLAVLPFYLGLMVEMDLRAIRVLRVLRVFKLGRYSMAMSVMGAVARQEARSIGAVLFVMMVILVLTSSLIYLFEHRAQPHVFSDIPTAMWWAVVTLTTLGYGDMVPVTPLGRLCGAFTAILGVGMIALPAGVLASGFSEQMRIRREEYREAVEKALEDGRLNRSEKRVLEKTRRSLQLSDEEASLILRQAVESGHLCPHCNQPLRQHHRSEEE
ncbi:potassium transporter Kef [Paramagnetospirillum marisnigri]|uniref:Potassium transporter Kef n=1 Tax=Paramagnetospirillum marisnigri TaxID=1285242 RepID=A0A178MPV1_9PROT|nr:ion transporter [Paramagnetospirillum marisnigri]OAN50583.1 potassium transporter Kef [Paramagnetospirillum marisnigri]